jgi:hypothetical protein
MNMYIVLVYMYIPLSLPWPEEARRFAHDTYIASILSTTGSLRFSLKMDFEVKTSR